MVLDALVAGGAGCGSDRPGVSQILDIIVLLRLSTGRDLRAVKTFVPSPGDLTVHHLRGSHHHDWMPPPAYLS